MVDLAVHVLLRLAESTAQDFWPPRVEPLIRKLGIFLLQVVYLPPGFFHRDTPACRTAFGLDLPLDDRLHQKDQGTF